LCRKVNGTTRSFTFGEHKLILKHMLSYNRYHQNFTGFDISGKSEAEIFAAAKSIRITVDETIGKEN
jgi:lysyl-tRNA synthetase class 2